jgi:hypothetical protein
MILIRDYYLDLLIVKNVNKTISIRVVLYIKEFEVDIAQRANQKNTIKKNINTNPKIISKLKDYYHTFTKVNQIIH